MKEAKKRKGRVASPENISIQLNFQLKTQVVAFHYSCLDKSVLIKVKT